jgi:hypothetical protein
MTREFELLRAQPIALTALAAADSRARLARFEW